MSQDWCRYGLFLSGRWRWGCCFGRRLRVRTPRTHDLILALFRFPLDGPKIEILDLSFADRLLSVGISSCRSTLRASVPHFGLLGHAQVTFVCTNALEMVEVVPAFQRRALHKAMIFFVRAKSVAAYVTRVRERVSGSHFLISLACIRTSRLKKEGRTLFNFL